LEDIFFNCPLTAVKVPMNYTDDNFCGFEITKTDESCFVEPSSSSSQSFSSQSKHSSVFVESSAKQIVPAAFIVLLASATLFFVVW